MGYGNVSERRRQPPQVGISVVILALGSPSLRFSSLESTADELSDTSADADSTATIDSDRVAGNSVSTQRASAHSALAHSTATSCAAASGTATSNTSTDASDARSRLWLPLVRRVRQPFLGQWALPGGSLRADLTLEQSAYCALESTTHLHPRYLEQLHTFGGPERSHGGLPMVSIVYWALVGQAETRDFWEADNVRWFAEDNLPDLAFDHREVIDHALRRLRERIEYPDLVTRLVGPRFTLRQLHGVVEAVTGHEVDLANFRRRMLASGQIEETGEKVREGRQRPAAVYRYVPSVDTQCDEVQLFGTSMRAVSDVTDVQSLVARNDMTTDDALGPLIPDRH